MRNPQTKSISVFIAIAFASTSLAEAQSRFRHLKAFVVNTGLYDGANDEIVTAYQQEIRAEGAPWLRVHIAEPDSLLDSGS